MDIMTRIITFFLGLPTLLLSLSVQNSMADQLPLWEAKIGIGVLNAPIYRGAKDRVTLGAPYPYVIYRGERFSIDERGMHSWLFKSDRAKLDISFAGGLPVPRDGDGPRAGMPKLDTTVEIGPEFQYRLWRKSDHQQLWLRIPVRAVVSLGDKVKHRGWTFAPFLDYRLNFGKNKKWKLKFGFGPQYANANYHDYYYGVDSRYVTPERPAYEGKSGYSGFRFTTRLSRSFGSYWLGIVIRQDTLKDAVFTDSPLVETDSYSIFAIAMSWTFLKSKTYVDHD